jgi:16S rRNA C1402 N4-methylase RsmH
MVYHCRFDRLEDAMEAFSVDNLSGALFDLGVSGEIGNSKVTGFISVNAPLDMRMDRTQAWTAADVVNGYPAEQLTRVLQQYGDERFARRIANAIVASRPVETTTELRNRRSLSGTRSSHRWASGEAHVPGDPDRGEWRARRIGACHRLRHIAHQHRWSYRRSLVPLR